MTNTNEKCVDGEQVQVLSGNSQAVSEAPKTPSQTPSRETPTSKEAAPCKESAEIPPSKESPPPKEHPPSKKDNIPTAKATLFFQKVSRRGIYAKKDVDGSRRNQLIRERMDELWLNRRLTSKGTVVGWYLSPEAHEPFWAQRKCLAPASVRRGLSKKLLSDEELKAYQGVGKARLSKKMVLTRGELRACARLFEEKSAVDEQMGVEKTQAQLKAARLARLLTSLEGSVV